MRGKNEQGWISVDDRLPEIDRDFGTGRNSICVLVGKLAMEYLQKLFEEERSE